MTEATIEDVAIKKVNAIWKRKPKGLGFEDTDAVIVTAGGISETFFICLKPDGTFEPKALNKTSQAHRSRLVSFLKHYRFADEIKGYNIREKSREWVGKKIELTSSKSGDYIYIP
jgi:hypothetical protein